LVHPVNSVENLGTAHHRGQGALVLHLLSLLRKHLCFNALQNFPLVQLEDPEFREKFFFLCLVLFSYLCKDLPSGFLLEHVVLLDLWVILCGFDLLAHEVPIRLLILKVLRDEASKLLLNQDSSLLLLLPLHLLGLGFPFLFLFKSDLFSDFSSNWHDRNTTASQGFAIEIQNIFFFKILLSFMSTEIKALHALYSLHSITDVGFLRVGAQVHGQIGLAVLSYFNLELDWGFAAVQGERQVRVRVLRD
jgi:hypothetical protein